MSSNLEKSAERLRILKAEAVKAIEADPVVAEVYAVLNDMEFMVETIPAIWESWGVKRQVGWSIGLSGIRPKFERVPMHLSVSSPVYPQTFVDAQRNLDGGTYGWKDLVINYKESITVEPMYWAIEGKYLGSLSGNNLPGTPYWRARVKLEDEQWWRNEFYGKSNGAFITLATPKYASEPGFLRMVVGYSYQNDGFEMAVVEESPRTKGERRFEIFSSFDQAKAFFALPYEQQEWGGMMVWSDYFRLMFKHGIYRGIVVDPHDYRQTHEWEAG